MTSMLSEIWSRLRSGTPRREARRVSQRLGHLRRMRLLENARAIFALMQDAKEKLQEDYIYDRAYLDALVDKALEKTAMLAFDAAVLSPTVGGALRARHRVLMQGAHEKLLRTQDSRRPCVGAQERSRARDTPFAEERMLREILGWLEDVPPGDGASVRGLLRAACDSAFGVGSAPLPEADGAPPLRLVLPGVTHLITTLDLNAGDAPVVGGEECGLDLACRPLGVLLMGAREVEDAPTRSPPPTERAWQAVLEEDRFQLHGQVAGENQWLVASLSGRSEADFLFLTLPEHQQMPAGVLEGFHQEPLDHGRCAWIYEVPGKVLEAHLFEIGRALFRDHTTRE